MFSNISMSKAEFFLKLVNEDSGNIEALHKLGITYAQLGENDAASKVSPFNAKLISFRRRLVVKFMVTSWSPI